MSRLEKKRLETYSAHRATKGIRSFKCGQSIWFIGYKKHSLRLWVSRYQRGVLLVPLVSWVTPANVSEAQLLVASLRRCEHRWGWWPKYVVADMGYLSAEIKRQCRQRWQVGVLTHLRPDMHFVEPFQSEDQVACRQGQPLSWLGYDPQAQEHWFGVRETSAFCSRCWEATQCPREFAYRACEHETLLGLLPLCTQPAQRMIKQMRPWIEPAQSYEKNQLGLSRMFLNSLRFTWWMSLLADAICLLRARALLQSTPANDYLLELRPQQLTWGWSARDFHDHQKSQ